MSNFFQRAIRERRRFWDPDIQSDEYHADWSNKERTYLTRNISFFITYALRDAPITANQITAFWVLLGSAGALLLACPHYVVSVTGVIFLYISRILDNVDGEFARYNKEFSDEGNFTDMVGHQVIFPLIFASLTYLAYVQNEPPVFIALGLLATALVTPLTKMQENVDLLRAFDTISREKDYLMPGDESKPTVPHQAPQQKDNVFLDFIKKLLGFLFTQCAITYLLIIAVFLESQMYFLVFYGAGITLFFVPKYFARKSELTKAARENRSLKDDVRPEWLDRNDLSE